MRRVIAACILVIILLGGSFLNPISAAAGLQGSELPLTTGGGPWEIHTDGQGFLWVSVYYAGEIWRVDPNGGKSKIFTVGGGPTDAYPDSFGNVWWVDGITLNRLNSASGTVAAWSLPGGTLIGVEIDDQGRIWTNNGTGKKLFRLNPGNNQLCSYALNHNAQSYPAVSGGMVWVTDTSNAYLARLNPNTNIVTWWELPSYTKANDLSADSAGNIWYTDQESYLFGGLGRLNPTENRLTEFSLPVGGGTNMLTVSEGKIWYTEYNQGTFGNFDPAQSPGSPNYINYSSDHVTPECVTSSPESKPAVTGKDTNADWTTASYPSLADAGGWAVYQLPSGSYPEGIAVTMSGWLVDLGRQVLVKFTTGTSIPPTPAPPSPTPPPSLGDKKTFIPMVRR